MSTRTLVDQLRVARWLLETNTTGLSHEDSLLQPEPGGNCLNWVVGHLVGARDLMLAEVLGGEAVLPEVPRKRYNRGAAPIRRAAEAPMRLEALLEAYATVHDRLVEALRAADEETLAAPAPFSASGRDDETVGSLLAALVVHDAYHTGQTGLLRRLAGQPGAIG